MSAVASIAQNGVISITSVQAYDMRNINQIPGAKRAFRAPGNTWTAPLTVDTCSALKHYGVLFTPDLETFYERSERVRRYIEHQKISEHVDLLKPAPIRAPYSLYEHQKKAFNIALALRNTALLMDMGTGKTISIVMVAGRRFLDGKIKRLLVIAPTSVCAVWKSEFEKFGDFPMRVGLLLGDRAQRMRTLRWLEAPAVSGTPEQLRVAVINYESTWRLRDERSKRDYLMEYNADMVVCDESQRIKSPSAKQSKACWALGAAATFRAILTGTPIQKDTRDLWSQYRFLDPLVFPISYGDFERRYAIMGGFEGRQYIGARNMNELTQKAHSIAYRVAKEECLDLPPKTFEEVPVPLDDHSMRLYKQLARQSIAELEQCDVTANHVLVRMLRLQQLTGGFLMGDDGVNRQINTVKLDALADIVDSLCLGEGKKLIIFTRFIAEMDAIQERVEAMLKTCGCDLVRVDGAVKASQRGDIVKQFQTNPRCRVFLGEIDACAEGLTLTAAQTVVYYSVNWNYAKYQQSADRIHRIGQTGTCTYLHLIAPGTIDAKIMRALKSKESLAKSVVDNWRSILSDD